MTTNLTPANLDGFIGTEKWYRWSNLFKWALVTDGAKYLAENGAAWMIDVICSHQTAKTKQITPQFWKLRRSGSHFVLAMERDEGDEFLSQKIPYTDFPLDNFGGEFKIWASWDSPDAFIVFLPSEY